MIIWNAIKDFCKLNDDVIDIFMKFSRLRFSIFNKFRKKIDFEFIKYFDKCETSQIVFNEII